MRVAVTGATSMIGVSLTEVCIRNGWKVLAIVRKNTRRLDRLPVSDLLTVQYADLEHLEEIREDGEPYDAFYHFAWGHTAKAERDDAMAQADNIRTTLQAIRTAKRLGCKRFIGAGSQAEYGNAAGKIDWNTPANPATAYGIAKLAAGLLGRKLCGQLEMDFIWARIFSVYGPRDNDGTMVNTAIEDFIAGRTAHFSAATQTWNYLYETDAGEMFYRLAGNNVPGGTYLIANPESRVLHDYIDVMMNTFGPGAAAEFAPERPGGMPGIDVDPGKTLDAIDYLPVVSFEEGIRKTIEAKISKTGKGR